MQPTGSTDTDYYVRMGLNFDPFERDALPDFFFVGGQRRFIVQRAVHALYFSGAIVLLLGVDGVGKTRTLDEIEKELKDLTDICRIEATVLMDAVEIRGLLQTQLGLPLAVAMSNVELVHALEQIRPIDGDSQPVLLAIDAAQLLSIATLVECAALIAGAGGRLRFLLAGELDLASAWQQAQVGAAEILELAALDRNEIADYVRTKLQAAGYREEQTLSDLEFDSLFTQSGGNFAAINTLTPQLLVKPPASSTISRRIKAIPLPHIGVIAGLLALLILLILYRGGKSPTATSEPLSLINSSPPSLDKKSATDRTPSVDQKNNTDQKSNTEQRTVPLQLPTVTPPPIASPDTPQSSAATSPPVGATPPATESLQAAPTEQAESKAIEKDITRKNTVSKTTSVAHTTVSKTSSADTSSFSADERALLEFPASNYVLQLIGAESKSTIDKFEKGAGRGLKLYCYRTQLRGKPWFIVVTQPYADKRAAQMALAALPSATRKQQPWPRTAANVQADIRAHSTRR